MNSFKEENLEISVNSVDSKINIIWKGRSEAREPGSTLNPYLLGLIPELTGKEVVVDFTSLEYMNSSTVSPILNLVNALESNNIKSVIIYDGNQKWQAASFKALQTIVNLMKNTKVTPKV